MNDLKDYWASLTPPLAPSNLDVEVYKKNLVKGSTLLLGSTKKLLELCDVAMDISPVYEDKKIIVGDWVRNAIFFENIIGDGVLNFNQNLCNQLLEMAEKTCNQFLVRSFNYRMPIMKVADYFPSAENFKTSPEVIFFNAEYSFYKWSFKSKKTLLNSS